MMECIGKQVSRNVLRIQAYFVVDVKNEIIQEPLLCDWPRNRVAGMELIETPSKDTALEVSRLDFTLITPFRVTSFFLIL